MQFFFLVELIITKFLYICNLYEKIPMLYRYTCILLIDNILPPPYKHDASPQTLGNKIPVSTHFLPKLCSIYNVQCILFPITYSLTPIP